ncbi:MAG: hypothetical protein ACI4NU_08370 [Christensenellales bacterium]
MKPMQFSQKARLFLLLALCLACCLACGCARVNEPDPNTNVFFVCNSAKEVCSVSLSWESTTEYMQRADNEPLQSGDISCFVLPESADIPVTVRIYAGIGQEMGEPLAEAVFTLDLSEGKTAVLIASDDADGTLVIEHGGQMNFELSACA